MIANMRLVLKLLSVALLLHACITSSLWLELGNAFQSDDLSYAQRRLAYAFQNLPVDRLAATLDQTLPAGSAITLGQRLAGNEFVRQRLSEGLYPGRIEADSKFVLDLDESGRYLLNQRPLPFLESPTADNLEFSLFSLLASLMAVMGLGTLALVPFRKKFVANALPAYPTIVATLILSGATVIACWATLTTWLQVSPGWVAVYIAGLASFALLSASVGVALARPGGLRKLRNALLLSRPESVAPALLVAALFARLVLYPVTLWDGRSIWLFHARQLFATGYLSIGELRDPSLLWSHPDYPLLLPAFLSGFSSVLGNSFNERMATLGIPVLAGATLALLWHVARRRLGRWPGAAFSLALFLFVARATAGAYADGLLMLLLALELLAFSGKDEHWLGWLAALAASLLKGEGLVLAAAIPTLVLLLRRTRTGSITPRARYFVCFLPAIAHRLWLKSIGVDSLLKGHDFSASLNAFPERFVALLSELWIPLSFNTYSQLRALLLQGLGSLWVVAAIFACLRRRPPQPALVALAMATIAFAFALVSISLLPEDVRWFAETALDRLLIHPAAFLIAMPFLWLAPPERSE